MLEASGEELAVGIHYEGEGVGQELQLGRGGGKGMGDGGCAEEERDTKGRVTDAVGKLPVRLSFHLAT